MVQVAGHLGMALLFSTPAWLVWGRRTSVTFVGFCLVTAMLPDLDLVLQDVVPGVYHHGVTHTVAFVVVAGVAGGALAAVWLTPYLERYRRIRSGVIPRSTVFAFAAGGFVLGGLSHVFADLLSAPDIAAPLKPLWPVYSESVIFDVVAYDSFAWNEGLLLAAVALHVALYRWPTLPRQTRLRVGHRRERGNADETWHVDADGEPTVDADHASNVDGDDGSHGGR